ncbi:hypothetical protein J4234_03195 [Candidatus Woesearchaeota archaeon]|nr:hypothetical protein [Candidatus Woesearchaeota archaeon]
MMQMRDWISGLVGALVFLLGLMPLMGKFEFLNNLPVSLLTWIVAGAGFYLAINSIIEITNSNVIGWWSFGVAIAVLIIGLFPLLHSFGIGSAWFQFNWLNRAAYNIIFIIEGVFLMIATFAMEL